VIILPVTKSRPCGKIRFRDRREAIQALRQASYWRSLASAAGVTTRRLEVRCYDCDLCRGVHLTSKPERIHA
jgi:hypothetical protein